MNTNSHFSVKHEIVSGDKGPPAPMQERSRKTAIKFIDAAMELLQEKTYAELSVADLARKAGRSVGVFYQRFGSKDDFLEVLLTAFFERSIEWRSNLPVDGLSPVEVYKAYLHKGFYGLLSHRNLWHAALERSAANPDFWKTYGPTRDFISGITRSSIEKVLGRTFDEEEKARLAFAGQVFNSVINNQIINGPGPLRLEDDDFFPQLEKVVLDIARIP